MVSLEPRRPASLADAIAILLRANAPAGPGTPQTLASVVVGAVSNTGSLKRATLAFLTGKSLGAGAAATENFACAVEYFHVASLLLDDLPCMDNAAVRRGVSCAHRTHGEAPTVLGALALINKAYALIWSAAAGLPRLRQEAVVRCVEECLGAKGVIGGQALDLAFSGTARSPREVGRAAIGKTVAMLRLALELPAIAAMASPSEFAGVRRLSVYWGLLYQAADDFADVGLAGSTGKSGGRDALLDRPNLVIRSGVETARARMTRWSALAENEIAKLSRMNPGWAFLRGVHASMPAPRRSVAAAAQPVAAA